MIVSEDGAPPLSPMQRRGQIEVDTFCTGCHYNLHGQAVTVDDRLNIPVCRCPECGRFHPAGTGVTASSIWVRRLATVLLFNWIGIVLLSVVAIGFFMGVMGAGAVGIYSYGVQMTPEGQLVEFRPNQPNTAGPFNNNNSNNNYYIAGTNTPAPRVVYGQMLLPIFATTVVTTQGYERQSPGPVPWCWLSVGSVTLGAVAAILCVSLMWHWPRRRYLWCVLLPLLALAVLSSVYVMGDEFARIRLAVVGRSGAQTALQCVGILIGIVVGRPIARAVVRVVIPAKPRQALAFLWQVDGENVAGVERVSPV